MSVDTPNHEYIHDHNYRYRPIPVVKQGVYIGTLFEFTDKPVAFGRDANGDLPTHVFMDYPQTDTIATHDTGHEVVKVVGADAGEFIPRAVAFSPSATNDDVVEWFNRLH